jgi:hypothetical protein
MSRSILSINTPDKARRIVGSMKSNPRMRRWSQTRAWALLVALPLLAAAEGWMVIRFLQDWQRGPTQVTLAASPALPPHLIFRP